MPTIVPGQSVNEPITAEMDRRNGRYFIWTQILMFFSAPVVYVGIVQAAFCERLGASATVSNLPLSTYLLGAFVPIVFACVFPARLDKKIIQMSFTVMALSMLSVCFVVFVPCPAWVRITVVIGQGLVIGIINSITRVYLFRCLSRGATAVGRARALKFAFGFGPMFAILGSLGAQVLLEQKILGISYPYNFGALYLIALPCMAACAILSGRYQLIDVPDEPRTRFFAYLVESIRSFSRDRALVLVWCSYLAWYFTVSAMPNLSLYTREVVGRAPIEMAGLILAIRFGTKAVAGFGLGSLAARHGSKSATIVAIVLIGVAIMWPFVSTGYGYLLAFGLMGAGELGAVYFFSYAIYISSPATVTRNLALLSLVSPVASMAPAIYGALTDRFSFHASFLFGGAMAVLSMVLILAVGKRGLGSSEAR